MTKKIKFPDIEDKEKAQLVFVRKYRQNKVTRYIFYRANINKNVSEELKKWLKEHIKKVEDKTLNEYSPDNYKDLEYVDLPSIDKWEFFQKHAFSIKSQEHADLSKIKSNLVAFIIYIQKGKEIIGSIRKITPSNVLNKTGLFTLFLENSAFNELREDKGIRIDKYSDFVFKITKDKSEGVIITKYNFNSIFDVYEQQKKESIKLLKNCTVISSHPESNDIQEIVKSDRTIQRMLINPIVKDHMNEINFDIIKNLKNEIQTTLAFEIDEQNKQIVFPNNNKKEAIRDFIKVISWKYSRSLDSTHIVEGNPEKIIK